jgi:hypothetical protein
MNQSVAEVIKAWPKEPQDSAKRLIDYYGEPDEYSQSRLIWYDTKDKWKRTIFSSIA